MELKEIHEKLVKGIKDYFSESNIGIAVIGLSGGLDSSLSAKLVVDAIGKANVHGILMPVKGLSNEENVKDTIELCKLLGINHTLLYINDFVKEFEKLNWQSKVAKINTAARARAAILYHYANTHKALVIGTSNKTEILLGYFTKYGDGAVDIEVLSSLFKTEEIELAKYLGIPQKIVDKTPTAELYHGQTDEDELGGTYAEIDKILKKLEDKEQVDGELAEKILKRIKDNEHKSKMPYFVRL
jgi:NAD+ synthase|tara:strand:- start:359 stop:1087 length:729 start_codon:yes stop_codon:yes gene_type:complete